VSVNWFYTIRTQLLTYSTVPKDSQPASATSITEPRKAFHRTRRSRKKRQPTQQHCRMTPKSQFATPDLKSTQLPCRPITVCKQHPVTRSTRYLYQQPAQPAILTATTSHKPEQTDRAVPTHPMSPACFTLHENSTLPRPTHVLASHDAASPPTLTRHPSTNMARKIDGVAASQTWSQAWGLGAGRTRAEYWGWARVGVRVR
jgi:hypothetical protein